MDDFKECRVCGRPYSELHHVVFRSQNKWLINCKLNHIYLCGEHHRGIEGVHGMNGREKDIEFKLEMQSTLFRVFVEESYTREEIKNLLGIKEHEADKMLKITPVKGGRYERVDIVRTCMGGILYGD